jgi:hypothetical protein
MRTFIFFQGAILLIAFALFGGWIANIIAIVNSLHGAIDAMFIARCVGVFVAPLGGVLGFI